MHPARADALFGLGDLYLHRGNAPAAETLLREALAIRRQALPAGHPDIARAERALDACLSALGRSG
jgi:tetratricopeptide (TPR) repeat protein